VKLELLLLQKLRDFGISSEKGSRTKMTEAKLAIYENIFQELMEKEPVYQSLLSKIKAAY
jgi:hypothetical protein